MESRAVPQDKVSTHNTTRKAIYAIGQGGAYEIVASSGWEVEAEATLQAVDELERLAVEAYEKVLAGMVAPLYFHMYNCRMDLNVLAQASGISRWRLKRHLRPEVFAKLSPKIAACYAEALGLTVAELYQLPKKEQISA
jgi:hypothetical protein